MSNIKWIKLYTDIFDNRKIKQIESLPEGDSILVIWLKILTLAGVTNDFGLVYITKDIPYTPEDLANAFNRPLNTVKLALATFVRYNMIEITDNYLQVSNWEEYQNIEGMEKVREQTRLRNIEYRKRKKEKLLTCDVSVTSHDAIDIDKEIEEDKEIDKDIDKNKKKKKKKDTPPKNKYGEYQNVLLTDDEYNKLHQKYTNADELIKYLDWYIQEKHYKSDSHYLAIMRWVADAVEEKKQRNKNKSISQQPTTSNPFLQKLIQESEK